MPNTLATQQTLRMGLRGRSARVLEELCKHGRFFFFFFFFWGGGVVLFCFVGCLTCQQHASVSQGRICTDNSTFCHTEIDVVDQTFYLTQSQYTDTGPTSASADPIMSGAWQGSHWSANFQVHWYDSTLKKKPVASEIRALDLLLPKRTP